MAEEFLSKIYEYADLISELRHTVEYIRMQDDHHSVMNLNRLVSKICQMCEECVDRDSSLAGRMWTQVRNMESIENDLNFLGDILENGLLPLMEEDVQSMAQIIQEDGDGFRLESTACGFLTIWDGHINRYLHSNNNPMEEARKYIETYYEPQRQKYSVYGCGLGYHIYQLYKVSRGSVVITLYDKSKKMVEYAQKYGVLGWIPSENLKIVTIDSVIGFLNSVNNNDTGMLMYKPSVYQIDDEIQREALLELYMQQSTMFKFERDIQINFWRNISKNIAEVENIDRTILSKEMVVVAAGPSLDDNIDKLREWKKKKTILAVGTVFKKLIKAGIRPDYVLISDPQERTLKQIEGMENETVPMILDVTAYWGFAHRYLGPKYLVYNSAGRKEIREYAMEHQYKLWPRGGTVTSLALEFAIHFGTKKIFLVGVDLAYPKGISHASGTMDRKIKKTDNMQKIPGTMGQTVYADRVFISYREGIEERIADEPQITFYNMSKIGAHIEGTIEPGDIEMLEE